MPNPILLHEFYQRDPKIVARALLGRLLVSSIGGKRASGIIVEVEAYLSKRDTACHGYGGKKNKNSVMFGPPGMAYVYPIHAKHCFNIVTETKGLPSAVLIRAIKPIENVRLMQDRRGVEELTNLCSGPAKLCQALGIDMQYNGLDLTRRRKIWIESPAEQEKFNAVISTARIGVTSAKESKLRYVFRNSEFASGPRKLNK